MPTRRRRSLDFLAEDTQLEDAYLLAVAAGAGIMLSSGMKL